MTSPADVAAFYREYDRHPGDRVRLFHALREIAPRSSTVLYPGSYVDIAPSVWFDDVTYVDMDKRAARFFAHRDAVAELVAETRAGVGAARDAGRDASVAFHHQDYGDPIAVPAGGIDILVSLYAGFISETCTHYLAPGGLLVANNSHGDASMASLDRGSELTAVILGGDGGYRVSTTQLETYLVPKRGDPPTVDELHRTNRGIAYTRSAYAYVFARQPAGARTSS